MSMRKEEMEKRRNERKEKAKGIKEKREKKRKEEMEKRRNERKEKIEKMEKRRKAAKEARNQLKKENKYGFSLFNNNNNASNMDTEEMDERLNEIAIEIEEEKKEHGLYLEDNNNVGNDEYKFYQEEHEFRRLDNEMENKKLRGKKWTENEEIEKNITDYMKDVGGKTRKTKKVRKHKGIHQTGGNKGRLKKGYKYSGKKLKNGKSEIIKCKSKKC